ncbi:hydrolase [Williamsia sp. Leaf354]|jgi:3-oxoadipate enol-lactonase|uniref:alpha/beta fold hydrolase n=1 Tax=Williamsia sp. Leaf354 TaxID=1736349 RepID=UPI0006F3EFE4|nr:alpha/beta hydrolase [Williamsia sp. Leaf354]KQR96572.1 hydrolase [Williamsia sp. Leaf354]
MTLVDVGNGVSLEVTRTGEGPAVLLVGGLGQPAQVWEYTGVVEALTSAGFETIAYCARGVAPSSAPEPPYAVDDLAFDAQCLVQTLGLEQVLVVAYSMGCYTTQALVRRQPGMVRAAVLLAGLQPSPIGELVGRMELGLLEKYGEIPADVMLFEQLMTTLQPSLLQDPASVVGWEQVLGASGEVWTSAEGMRGQLQASYSWITANEPLPEHLAAFDLPALVLAFEHDLFFPPQGCRAAAGQMPNAEFTQIDGVAHGGLFTGQTDTVARIVAFCTAHRPA